ncbi:transposase [Aquimarina aggregata]|uniref:transposase n=1 Tax=Aquimarina aggregata TaxID=1642818 RepID=UPI00373FCACC
MSVDFSSEEIHSDSAIVLLEKLEHSHKVINYFSNLILDKHHSLLITHSIHKLVKYQVVILIRGYDDYYDVLHLQRDPLYKIF